MSRSYCWVRLSWLVTGGHGGNGGSGSLDWLIGVTWGSKMVDIHSMVASGYGPGRIRLCKAIHPEASTHQS
jgi:hypothetical protein